ncbi:hypothetical protein BH20ACT16_BH20ACT16_05940 [soil metagenome]
MEPSAAVGELRSNAGTQFDPAVVDAALVVLTRDREVALALTGRGSAA